MDTPEDILAERGAPRTLTVLATLMGVALLFSWLVAYALFDALVAAEMISRASGGTDPRPRWLLGVFTGFMSVFGLAAVFFRTLSRRQLARIDEMGEDD
jgi:hypothetical protein